MKIKEMKGWLIVSLKSTETSDKLLPIYNPMSRCLSTAGATSLHHCLKNDQLNNMVSMVRIQVFSVMHR